MTKVEQRKMRVLEIQNEEYRVALNRAMEVYREMSHENIELRARIEYIEEVLLHLGTEIQCGVKFQN